MKVSVLMLMTAAVAGWMATGPVAAADPLTPTGGRAADAVVDDLQSQGYTVQINWLTGYDTKPLSQCRVVNVNNPGNIQPSADTFPTVYVDVRCPNGDDDGFGFGGGVGFG